MGKVRRTGLALVIGLLSTSATAQQQPDPTNEEAVVATPAPAVQAATLPAPSATPATPANDPPPDSDVFLTSLDIPKQAVGTPKNITRREGYDNQPAFLNDGSALLYVVGKDDATDIYRYDIATGLTTRVTRTDESEYSPTPLPDNRSFSAVRVAKPNAQGTDSTNPPVWRYGLDGKPGEQLIDVTAVGYHAWLDPAHIAVFVVGDEAQNQAHKLLLVDLNTGASTLLSEAPGRQLGRTPDRKRVSFVDKSDPKHWRVVARAAGDDEPLFLVDTPRGPDEEKEEDRSEDYTWLPDGSLMMAKGNTLLRWDGRPGAGLKPFATLENLGGDIKRLAVSKDGKQLAFVVQLRRD